MRALCLNHYRTRLRYLDSIIFCEVVAIYGVVRNLNPASRHAPNEVQIIGIVYSGKISTPVADVDLYTPENYFTGTRPFPVSPHVY